MGADERMPDILEMEIDDANASTFGEPSNPIAIALSNGRSSSSRRNSWKSFREFFAGDSDDQILSALETLLVMRKEGSVVTPFDDLLEELEKEEEEEEREMKERERNQNEVTEMMSIARLLILCIQDY